MFGTGIIRRGFRAIATGQTQSRLGLQSPHLPGTLVRVGRFMYTGSALAIAVTSYAAYVNETTDPGGGPKLVLPGSKKRRNSPARSERIPAFLGNGGTTQPGGPSVSGNLPGSGKAGGFLPRNAGYKAGRKDQGRDGQTDPGGAIIAPGNGTVVRVGNDPRGFGPAYPIVKFSSGPYAGRTMYVGHTFSALSAGQIFRAGDILSRTGRSGVGNATVPGWFEIGFADTGTPGPMGQAAPF